MTDRLKLFVCGSLSEGMVHFQKISGFLLDSKPAKAKGTVFRLEVGYPVFSHIGNDIIHGHLFEIKNDDMVQALLDSFHGVHPKNPERSVYFRELLQVENAEGQHEQVIVYSVNLKKLPDSTKRIEGGNWNRDFTENPPMTFQLSDRQKEYIRKLGQSSGRDIVPIKDLELYRQLMGRGLIVDKGRRLALTRLGQDVFRYLE
ncbi:MAG: gamma-glutamylcyclotransferase [Bdellovibrionales bacterium]|nr:gamma-glutamylcyclotransferase [Bdellovibrionales bacterium]